MSSIRFAGALAALAIAFAAPSHATGLATCASGSQDGWQPQEKLTAYFHPRTLAPVPAGSKDHKG